VFGGLKLLGQVCLGAFGLIGVIVLMNAPQPAPGQPDPIGEIKGLVTAIDQEIPEIKYIMGFELLLAAIMTVFLIVGGIGLLKLRPWGRTVSLIYALVTVIVTRAGSIYSAVSMEPRMQHVVSKWEAKQNKQPAGGVGQRSPANNPLSGVTNLFTAILG